ncbi:hypothetical protein EDB85DRAFT_2282668 [Lactarius pseudohatsudake]|nr:hypothetical protein EDB85DRAFT_2282668 [Lactarius pseudohatsudake]
MSRLLPILCRHCGLQGCSFANRIPQFERLTLLSLRRLRRRRPYTFQSDILFVALYPTAGSPCLVATPEALRAYGVLNKILAEHHVGEIDACNSHASATPDGLRQIVVYEVSLPVRVVPEHAEKIPEACQEREPCLTWRLLRRRLEHADICSAWNVHGTSKRNLTRRFSHDGRFSPAGQLSRQSSRPGPRPANKAWGKNEQQDDGGLEPRKLPNILADLRC